MLVLLDTAATFAEWKRLVVAHSVTGVSVHDARIAAQMSVWHVGTILTLNPSDFHRYSGTGAIHLIAEEWQGRVMLAANLALIRGIRNARDNWSV